MEEDIKIIEELIAGTKAYGEYEGNKYFKSMEHLIARNKELEEEKFNNERTIELFKKGYSKIYKELNINSYAMNENVLINEIKTNFIPKSKVREKIEEFKIPIFDVLDKLPIMPRSIERGIGAKDGIIYALQKLLEERED